MTPSDLRRAMRQRKRELRRSVALQMERNPAIRRQRNRRRIRRGIGLALLLVLASFINCQCDEAQAPRSERAPEVSVKVEPTKKVKAPTNAGQKPLRGELGRQPRAELHSEGIPPPSWLEEFRIQVAARSPRLARCFRGTDRPGALRWSAAVNAESGTVSDHALEPVGPGGLVDNAQRQCVLNALSSPGYRLKAGNARALPERVSIVIEF
jgi:hypothetical protein